MATTAGMETTAGTGAKKACSWKKARKERASGERYRRPETRDRARLLALHFLNHRSRPDSRRLSTKSSFVLGHAAPEHEVAPESDGGWRRVAIDRGVLESRSAAVPG
jgi:hypothetical protein